MASPPKKVRQHGSFTTNLPISVVTTNTSVRHPLLDTRRDTSSVNSTSPGDSLWKKKRPRMSVLSDYIRGR
ncbi:hypothetical protein ARMGADRAFT_1013622 [Armillaria gallica]|uniref:Uncharacterized protein n=1 Tax=Armillaria gallica TaxID=47427 RepID=A0A2H3DCI2_ARMGA|nr:hypothetical protein ARMGADRAFT_1013622 [Armillaria gallica]